MPDKLYVVGFAFDTAKTRVALIRKNRPTWQAGRLNGIGGKIEEGETPLDAMSREFQEETGYPYPIWWESFCVYSGPDYTVNFFYAAGVNLQDCRTATDEEVIIFKISEIPEKELIYNLNWLIPLALDEFVSEVKVSE